jgi:hypothetical protein
MAVIALQRNLTQLHQEANRLALASQMHHLEAIQLHEDMEIIEHMIVNETHQAYLLHQQAMLEKNEFEVDAHKAWEWYQKDRKDEWNLTLHRIVAEGYYEQSQREMNESTKLLQESEAMGEEAQTKIDEAQEEIKTAQELQDGLSDTGFCSHTWAERVCNAFEPNQAREDRLQMASQLSVKGTSDLNAALQEQQQAQKEHDEAIQLYTDSMQDKNISKELLEDVDELRSRVERDRDRLHVFVTKARAEAREAFGEEHEAREEDELIAENQEKLETMRSELDALYQESASEAHELESYNLKIRHDRFLIHELAMSQMAEWDVTQQHVRGVCWYAILGLLFFSYLLLHVSYSIYSKFTYSSSRPWLWIVREEPHTKRDLSYAANHLLILLLAIGSMGSLLVASPNLHVFGQVKLLLFVASWPGLFQVMLFHFIPHTIKLSFSGQFDARRLRRLVKEDLMKRLSILVFLFLMEVGIFQVGMGQYVGPSFYQGLNGWLLWTLTIFATLVHVYYFEFLSGVMDSMGLFDENGTYTTSESTTMPSDSSAISFASGSSHYSDLSSRDMISNNSSIDGRSQMQVTEMSSLMPESRTSMSANESSISMETGTVIDVFGGAMRLTPWSTPATSVASPVANTFLLSFRSEIEKLQLVLDIWVAVWCMAGIFNEFYILKNFYPVSPSLIWGPMPWWATLGMLFSCSIIVWLLRSRRPPGDEGTSWVFTKDTQSWDIFS